MSMKTPNIMTLTVMWHRKC